MLVYEPLLKRKREAFNRKEIEMNRNEIDQRDPETQDATTEVHLDLTVRYSNVEEGDDVRASLESAVFRQIGAGMLTSNFPDIEVDEYRLKVVQLTGGAQHLDEDEIAQWISLQIESGSFDLEDLPRRMARWALSSPADMRNELAERMGKESI